MKVHFLYTSLIIYYSLFYSEFSHLPSFEGCEVCGIMAGEQEEARKSPGASAVRLTHWRR